MNDRCQSILNVTFYPCPVSLSNYFENNLIIFLKRLQIKDITTFWVLLRIASNTGIEETKQIRELLKKNLFLRLQILSYKYRQRHFRWIWTSIQSHVILSAQWQLYYIQYRKRKLYLNLIEFFIFVGVYICGKQAIFP